MAARLIVLGLLLATAAPAGAAIKDVPREVIACHDEATQRYIADIRQVGLPQQRVDGSQIIVTHYQNENPRFEEYVAECLNRSREKAR